MSADGGHEQSQALPMEARLHAWLNRAHAQADETNRRSGLHSEHVRTHVAREQTRTVPVRTAAEAPAGGARAPMRAAADQGRVAATGAGVREDADVAQVRVEAREPQRPTAPPIDQSRADAGPDATEAQADASVGLAARERQWRADAARERQFRAEATRAQAVAVQEALAAAETKAAAARAAEQTRWADDAKQTRAAEQARWADDAKQTRAAEQARWADDAKQTRAAEQTRWADDAKQTRAAEQARWADDAKQTRAAEQARWADDAKQTLAAEQARWVDDAKQTLAAEQARWAEHADQALAVAVEAAIRNARAAADADAAATHTAEAARVRAKAEHTVSLAVTSVRSEANQARAVAISRMRKQVRHALLRSKRIVVQARGEANHQREAAKDELRRVTETLTAKIEAAKEREAAVHEARVAAESNAAAALAVAQGLWADDAERALAGAVDQTQAEADERLASRERQWKADAAREHDPVIRKAPDTDAGLDLQLLDSNVQPGDGPAMATAQAWQAEDTPTRQATAQQTRRKPRDLTKTPGSTHGDDAPPATPDVDEGFYASGSHGNIEFDLRLLDSDTEVSGTAAMAAAQAWQVEDAPKQQTAVHGARATARTEAVADRQDSPTAPDALPATGWTRFLRRTKKPPKPSAKDRSSGSKAP